MNHRQHIQTLIDQGQLDAAMQNIVELANTIAMDPMFVGEPFGIDWLDAACLEIGARTLASQASPTARGEAYDAIYLATMVAPYGGHSRVLEDFIAAQPGKRQLVLLTGIFGQDSCHFGIEHLRKLGVTAESIPDGTWTQKLALLQNWLRASPDAEVFLFGHPQDALVIAAVQPGLNRRVSYFHHCDHQYTLGLYLPFARHFDPHPAIHERCRQQLGVPGQMYLPMSVADLGMRPPGFLQDGRLTSCTSGTFYKFNQLYPFNYLDMLPDILDAGGGRHVHIGDLPDAQLAALRQRMAQRGISPERFHHIPWTPSVWRTVIEERVDVYLQSFPFNGGRATIEILGSGTPIANHVHAAFSNMNGQKQTPHDAFQWRDPESLYAWLRQISPEYLADQSQKARAHYERYYRPELLAECLAADQPQPDIPPLYETQADPFNRYLFHKLRLNALAENAKQQGINEMKQQVEALQQQLVALQQKHAQQLAAVQHQYEQVLATVQQEHAQNIQYIRDQVAKLAQGN